MGGVVMMFAGAAVYYRTRLQPTIALSSTKAEFMNMTDAGKAALYLRWILEDLNIVQTEPTRILADNAGAVQLCNAGKPTRRTRHVEQKHFIILQWTDDELINFVQTPTDQNYSDTLSKQTARTKFYEHTDIFMGRRKPAYAIDGLPNLGNNLGNNSETDKQQHEQLNNDGNLQQPIPIIHYMSFSTSNNVNNIINNPLYDILQ